MSDGELSATVMFSQWNHSQPSLTPECERGSSEASLISGLLFVCVLSSQSFPCISSWCSAWSVTRCWQLAWQKVVNWGNETNCFHFLRVQPLQGAPVNVTQLQQICNSGKWRLAWEPMGVKVQRQREYFKCGWLSRAHTRAVWGKENLCEHK